MRMTTTFADFAMPSRQPRRRQGLLWLPMLALCALVAVAGAYVGYVLWPRWPGAVARIEAPPLPVVVGGVTFNVPPAAIRVPLQRKAGVQERIDLEFLWPSLAPPSRKAKVVAVSQEEATLKPAPRIFVTVAASAGELSPLKRLKDIYPRYIARERRSAPAGLVALRFRNGTPYRGEDLIYEAAHPQQFFVRCSRDSPAGLPGICLDQRRLGEANVIVRFPRDWLADWQKVAGGIDRLIARLQPH